MQPPLWIIIVYLCMLCVLTSCTYIQSMIRQANYAQIQKTSPSQHNLKHLIDKDTFFVYGRILSSTDQFRGLVLSVAAYSSRYKRNELVDFTYVAKAGTHFGLNLPEGQYDLLVLADRDENQIFDQSEVVGRRQLDLGSTVSQSRVVNQGDIAIVEQVSVDWRVSIPAPIDQPSQESVFFPKGTIRQLNDPLFDRKNALLGMYDPAAFMEQGSTMFYTLEEDSHKIPVVFVHGISGTAREFQPIINRLDRQQYQPWFFYYPSGNELEQLADLFYDIFLSGDVIERGEMPMAIVAHSMGGLVVREALNKYLHRQGKNQVVLFISLASPFDGHPGASSGVKNAPMVVPSWRDLDPNSAFIGRLFREPVKGKIDHHILYARGDPGAPDYDGKSDGTVPIASQLRSEALTQSSEHMGFDSTHVGILKQDDVIRYILQSLKQVKNVYPIRHLEKLKLGGYDVELNSDYSDRERYYIHTMGKYLEALATGNLDTVGSTDLEHFRQVIQGKSTANNAAESAWLKFVNDYPNISTEHDLIRTDK